MYRQLYLAEVINSLFFLVHWPAWSIPLGLLYLWFPFFPFLSFRCGALSCTMLLLTAILCTSVYLCLCVMLLVQGLYGRGNGYYLTSIWCFMTAKWGLLMLFYTRQYLRLYCGKYRSDTTPLINGWVGNNTGMCLSGVPANKGSGAPVSIGISCLLLLLYVHRKEPAGSAFWICWFWAPLLHDQSLDFSSMKCLPRDVRL